MYEFFSVISGIVLLVCVALPSVSGTNRLWAGAGGAFLVIYGVYVSTRTTGTYTFPIVIFFIPFLAIGYIVFKAVAGSSTSTDRGPGGGPPAVGSGRERIPGPGERTPEELAALGAALPPLSGDTPRRGPAGSACARTGCPRQGWVVWEDRCQACGQATVAAPAT